MYHFFQRLRYLLSRFLSGRYGVDALFLPLLILSCGFTFLSNFKGLGFLHLLGTAVLCYALFRVCSRNFHKRQKELYAYSNLMASIQKYFGFRKKMFSERHLKKYFKCPNCKVYLSVPKGKGKLKIRCTKCHHEFVRKS